MSAEPHCNRCEFDDNWGATGQVHGEGGLFIPVAAPSVGWVFAKTTRNTCFLILITGNIFHTYFNDKKVKLGIAKQSYSF